jgi:hypothetical protein
MTAVALVAAIAFGCRSTDDGSRVDAIFDQPLVAATNEDGSPGALELLQPADVFVVPVSDQSAAFAAPLASLRAALYEGLADRLYSPLDLEWADTRLSELSTETQESGLVGIGEAGAALAADAMLEVRLLYWDEGALESDGRVGARLEARLVDPNRVEEPLWGYRIGRVVELGAAASKRATRDVLVERVAGELARELLALLPARDARRAPRN